MSRRGERATASSLRRGRFPGAGPRGVFQIPIALAWLLAATAALPFAARAAHEDLIEVYDRDRQPLRTRSIEIEPKAVANSVERQAIRVRVTLTGIPEADGELVVRQIGGNEFGAFYGRLVPFKAGQNVIELECHLNPAKGGRGSIIVQGYLANSYKALAGAVTAELQVTAGTTPASANAP